MSMQESVSALMAEVGPAANLFVVDEYADEALWHIAVDEQTTIFAELDEDRNVLVLSAEVARPLADQRAALYAFLLRYNHAWHATGGARFSVDAEDGAAWLLLDVASPGLACARFSEHIADFTQKLNAWRGVIEKFEREPADPHNGLDLLSLPGLIRS